MTISTEIPPVYKRCRELFKVDWNKGIVMTYGDTIHYKWGDLLPEDFLVHEQVHVTQQMKMGKEVWWENYFVNKDFRLSQEIEAYRAQWQWILLYGSRKLRRERERSILKDMSTLYGDMCTEEEARNLIM